MLNFLFIYDMNFNFFMIKSFILMRLLFFFQVESMKAMSNYEENIYIQRNGGRFGYQKFF